MSLINDALRAVRSKRSTPPTASAGGAYPASRPNGGGALVPVIAGCVGVGILLMLLIAAIVFALRDNSKPDGANSPDLALAPADSNPPPLEVSAPEQVRPSPFDYNNENSRPTPSGDNRFGAPPPSYAPPAPAGGHAPSDIDTAALQARIERLTNQIAESQQSSEMERNRLGDTVATVIELLDDRGGSAPSELVSKSEVESGARPLSRDSPTAGVIYNITGPVTIGSGGVLHATGPVTSGGGAAAPMLGAAPMVMPGAAAMPGPAGMGNAWAPQYYPVYPGMPYSYPQQMAAPGQQAISQATTPSSYSGPSDPELLNLHEQNQRLLDRLSGIGTGLEEQKATPIVADAPLEEPSVLLAPAAPTPKPGKSVAKAVDLPASRMLEDDVARWERAVAQHDELWSADTGLPPSPMGPNDLYTLLNNQDEEEPIEITRWEDQSIDFNRVFRGREVDIDPGFRAGPLRLSAFDSSALTTGDFNLSLVDKGFKPSDAKLRIGNLFIDAKHLQYSMIWSDNVDRVAFEEGDPRAGFVQMISLEDVAAILQLSEGFRFAASGNLIYLPSEGKGGLNGFGIRRDVLSVPLADGESDVFAMEVSDTARIGGWDVVLADKLHLSDTALQAKYDARILEELTVLEEQALNAEDREGLYSFGELGGRDSGDLNSRNRLDDRVQDNVNTTLVNDASITASKLVPTDTRLTMTLFRRDSEPLDPDSDDSQGLHEWREGVSFIAASERPGLRFKPYTTYTREHTNDNPEWRETGRVGFWGPLSDYLDLTASAGFTKEPGGSTDHLYDLSLFHQPRWNTTQALTFSRTITLPEDKLVTESNYRLQHQISDYWGAAAFVGRETTENRVNGMDVQDTEWGAGGSLVFSPGPKLRMALRGIYDDRKTGGNASPGADNGGEWNWNFAATYQFTPEIDFYYSYTREQKDWEHLFETKLRRGKLELAYRFIWSEDHEPDKEELENLVILTYRVPL
ncbi:MAG: hypothetical protein ACI8W8_003787 [Rhodothermales bacterium]|jgi:hypothetical protein